MSKKSAKILSKYIEQEKDNMLNDLEKIVNLDSGSRDKPLVDKLGKLLADWWLKEGFIIEETRYEDVGNCYVAKLNETSLEPKVVLIGHFDTVFPANEALKRPFKIDDNIARGPGVADMKGGLITMLYAIKALKTYNKLNGNVSIILNSHEEIGSLYFRDIIEKEAKNAGLAINLEPARENGDIVTGRKGAAFLYMTVNGKAAHAGVEPKRGANANLELAHRIIELQNLNDFYKGLTVNVDVINGGSRINMIPDVAKAEVDIRFIKKIHLDKIMELLDKSIIKTEVIGTTVEIFYKTMFLPMERKDNVITAYNLVLESARELGIEIKEAFTGGGSDAGFVSELDIPTICGMGPIGGNCHSEDEYIELSSLTERCKVLAVTIDKFLNS